MREAGPIPRKKLPNVMEMEIEIRRRVVDRPDPRLGDMSIGQLVSSTALHGSPVYLVGSHVWTWAVFGQGLPVREKTDYDLLFSSDDSVESFLTKAIDGLNRRLPKHVRYTRAMNSFGNGRVLHPSGESIIDAWSLCPNESIAEALMDFPEEYQRAALPLTEGAGLIRIVAKGPQRKNKYPGRRQEQGQPRFNAAELSILDEIMGEPY